MYMFLFPIILARKLGLYCLELGLVRLRGWALHDDGAPRENLHGSIASRAANAYVAYKQNRPTIDRSEFNITIYIVYSHASLPISHR